MAKSAKQTWTRRRWLSTSAGFFGAAPYLWIPSSVRAQGSDAKGKIKHLIYIRLSGGFRFPAAFNAKVDGSYNPFGVASRTASGTQWGVSSLLEGGGEWLTDARSGMGMLPVEQFSNEIAVLPCVDHEPDSPNADGNHQTGLERFLTGYPGGVNGLFSLLNYGLRERKPTVPGKVDLPAIIMGAAGMGKGHGKYAAFRPPLLRGGDLGGLGKQENSMPEWAQALSVQRDQHFAGLVGLQHRPAVESLIVAKNATRAYQEIFKSEVLSVEGSLDASADGISNRELRNAFGNDRAGREVRLALRLFSFGCPAVYIDQGGYDYHSEEENRLPGAMARLNHLLSAIRYALKTMDHPSGGKYWDHTAVVLGSEFSRSARGRRFNSARGSDHGGDRETRWMSMPMMGGPITKAGQMLGGTRRDNLAPTGKVYGYRSLMRSLFLGLGADVSDLLVEDDVFDDFMVG